MSFHWPRIRRNDRVAIIGPSGSGKTELAKSLLMAQPHVIVLDTKRSEDWSAVGEYVNEKDVYRVRGGRYVFQVPRDFLVDRAQPERFFRWALDRGSCVIFVDEQLDVIPTDAEKILATQGRSAGVGLWVGSQRPHGIPLYVISEARHFFIFGLNIKDDQKRMEEATGQQLPWDALRRYEYGFVYMDHRGRMQGPTHLALDDAPPTPMERADADREDAPLTWWQRLFA